MIIMEPVLTFVTLDPENLSIYISKRLSAKTIRVKIILIVSVFLIFIFFLVLEVARLRHSSIAAIASEISFRVKLYYIMIGMAMDHAAQAETARLNKVD